MLKKFLAVMIGLGLSAPIAFADSYNLTIAMSSPGGNAVQCKPYVNATALAPKPCSSSAVSYPGAIPSEGKYTFAYSAISQAGAESDLSPRTVEIMIDKKPPTPSAPPSFSIKCRDGSGADVACPATITITPAASG